MRTSNSIKNAIIALICNSCCLILNFIVQSLFINRLGINYSGLNNILTNIISMLAISELGIGTAIIYHLYKPIHEKNITKIKVLVNFYKKAYNIIAIVVFIIGILILPFISFFIDATQVSVNIYVVYFLFLIDATISYFVTYKRSIIYANQKNRILDLIHLGSIVIMSSLQIFVLIKFKNYFLFLFVRVICRLIENIVINFISNKLYPYLKQKENTSLDPEIKNDIKTKVKAQLYHSIGGYIVLGTDNILVSKFFGLTISGIYGNYILIINAANTIIGQIFNSLTASVGSLLVEKDYSKSYKVYRKINLLNFLIYSLVSVTFYFLINDFIKIWLHNENYLFSNLIVLSLAINLYLQGMRRTIQIFATAGGICHENRFIPIIESIINIVFSIIFLKLFGVIGIIIGTIISTLFLYFYGFPKYIYCPLFKKGIYTYIKDFVKYVIVLIFLFCGNSLIISLLSFNNIYIQFVVRLCCVIITTSLMLLLIFYRNNDLKEFMKILTNKLKRS